MIDKRIKKIVDEWELVGSRVTCNPAPQDTDQDILCLLEEGKTLKDFEDIVSEFEDECFPDYYDHDGIDLNDFGSYKNEDHTINYIVTTRKEFYDRFMVATRVARDFNLLEKHQRKQLFQAVLYSKYLPPEEIPF
jgi:hypothetical protein